MGNAALVAQMPQADDPPGQPVLGLAQGGGRRPHAEPRHAADIHHGDVSMDGTEVEINGTVFAEQEDEDLFTLGAGPCHALAIHSPGKVRMVAHLANDTTPDLIAQWRAQLDEIVRGVYAGNGLSPAEVAGNPQAFEGTRIHLTGGYDYTDSAEDFDQKRFDDVVAFLERAFPGADLSFEFNPADVHTTEDDADVDGSVSLELAFDGTITVEVG